jgi:hypothetical protein
LAAGLIEKVVIGVRGTSVKLHCEFTHLNGKTYLPGDDVPWVYIYPFFLFQMLGFGGPTFYFAYAGDGSDAMIGLAVALISTPIYLIFYRGIFGREEVRWIFINGALGILGIAAEVRWLLSLAGKQFDDYPWIAHIGPFMFYMMCTFLLRHAALDLLDARSKPELTASVERHYVLVSLLVYCGSLLLQWVL